MIRFRTPEIKTPEQRAKLIKEHGAMTTGEVAKFMNVDVQTVRKMIHEGLLSASPTPGGHFRIKQEDLSEYLKSSQKRQGR